MQTKNKPQPSYVPKFKNGTAPHRRITTTETPKTQYRGEPTGSNFESLNLPNGIVDGKWDFKIVFKPFDASDMQLKCEFDLKNGDAKWHNDDILLHMHQQKNKELILHSIFKSPYTYGRFWRKGDTFPNGLPLHYGRINTIVVSIRSPEVSFKITHYYEEKEPYQALKRSGFEAIFNPADIFIKGVLGVEVTDERKKKFYESHFKHIESIVCTGVGIWAINLTNT